MTNDRQRVNTVTDVSARRRRRRSARRNQSAAMCLIAPRHIKLCSLSDEHGPLRYAYFCVDCLLNKRPVAIRNISKYYRVCLLFVPLLSSPYIFSTIVLSAILSVIFRSCIFSQPIVLSCPRLTPTSLSKPLEMLFRQCQSVHVHSAIVIIIIQACEIAQVVGN